MKSKQSRKLLAFGSAIISLLAHSNPVFSQTPTLRYENAESRPHYPFYTGLPSHRAEGITYQTFTSFVFENDEAIHQFRWRGAFRNAIPSESSTIHTPLPSDVGSWEVTIWADNDGRPARVPLATHVLPASEVTRGDARVEELSTGVFTSFDHAFELPTPFEAAAGTRYWISPVYLGSSSLPRFALIAAAAGQVPVPQMSWAAIRPSLSNTLLRVHNNEVEVFNSDENWEYREYQANIKLITVPSNDSDHDGMDDDWEKEHELDTWRDDSLEDADGDGSNNLDEFVRKTDPNAEDSDGDGLLDGLESNTGIFVDSSDTGTSPLLVDSDRDGLDDAAEVPTLEFTGLEQPGTDPNQRDSDRDGYADGLEINQGLDPTDENSLPSLIILDGLIGNDLTDPEDDGTSAGRSASEILIGSDTTPVTGPEDLLGTHEDLFDGAVTGTDSYWKNRPLYRVDVTLLKRQVLESFTLTSGVTSRDRDPLSWEIQGSNDGEIFETIFHRHHSTQSVWTANSQTVRFDVGVHYETPAAYSTFRLRLYEYEGQPPLGDPDHIVELAELELFGSEAEMIVTNTNDDGPGSLRQAIADCPENGVILFDPAISGERILLTGQPTTINRSLTIDGSALSNGIVLGRSDLLIAEEATVTISKATIIDVDDGVLRFNGAGYISRVRNYGKLTLNQVTIKTTGGLINFGELTLNDSIIANNVGVCVGGIRNNHEMSAYRSTFVGNGVASCFDFTPVVGSAIDNSGNCLLDHCTVSGNHGYAGAISNEGTLQVSHSTIVGNHTYSSEAAGGITVLSGQVEISNCIIANNTNSEGPDNLYKALDAEVHFAGHNLTNDLSGSGLTETSAFIIADPRLAPLGDYGGPTPTMPLLPGSPAIDVPNSPVDASVDQRGFPRLVGSDYDLGAVESQGEADFARIFLHDHDGDGIPFVTEQALGTDPNANDPENPRNLTLPTFNEQGHAVLAFGINPNAHPDTLWILERSTDLRTFTEIYRFDSSSTVLVENISTRLDGDFLSVIDQGAPAGSAFYRFRAMLHKEGR